MKYDPLSRPHTSALLFDLDGTLTDPAEGITKCIKHALETIGEPAPEATDLLQFIGPPLYQTFQKLVGDPIDSKVSRALSAYRDRFRRVGMYENKLYGGVVRALDELDRRGLRLYLVTSKPAVFARPIVEHFKIASHFEEIYGRDWGGQRTDKAELISYVLGREELASREVVMIGDRKHDVFGARANGVYSIGVTWGYGSQEELTVAGADATVDSMDELMLFVNRLCGDR